MRTRPTILFFILVAIAVPARAQWQPNGLVLNGGAWPLLVPDGSGGAFVTWNYYDPWGGQFSYGMAQRVDAAGNQLWQPGGKILCDALEHNSPQVVSDGSGGAIFVWYDNRSGPFSIFAQRLNAAGAEQWGECGVPVRDLPANVTNDDFVAVPDGAGGVIVTWADPRAGTFDIYGQHLNASGTPQWIVNGAAVCIAPGIQADALAVADGLGGIWIAWLDARGADIDLYARHINNAGTLEGPATGWAFCSAAGDQIAFEMVSDAAGGMIVVWEDRRTGWDIYAQRMSLAGNMLWGANGTPVCNQAATQEFPNLASDGAGGAIVVWKDSRTLPNNVALFAQHLNGAGQAQWTPDGNQIGTSQDPSAMRWSVVISDGNGESIVAWHKADYDNQISDLVHQLLVQRLSANGSPEWAQPAVVRGYTNIGDGGVDGIAIASDGWGGAIVSWNDWSYWQASDVRVGHVSPGGVATDITPTRGPSMMAVDVYPNPFSTTAKLNIELGKSSSVEIDVFDVAGRKVRSFSHVESNREHVIDLTDRDDAGHVLASGVYFCRVRAATGTVTRKIVITR